MTPGTASAGTPGDETIESVRLANALVVNLGARIASLLLELEEAKTQAGQLRGLLWSAAIDAGGRLDIGLDRLRTLSDDCTLLLEFRPTMVSAHAREGVPQAAPEPARTIN